MLKEVVALDCWPTFIYIYVYINRLHLESYYRGKIDFDFFRICKDIGKIRKPVVPETVLMQVTSPTLDSAKADIIVVSGNADAASALSPTPLCACFF